MTFDLFLTNHFLLFCCMSYVILPLINRGHAHNTWVWYIRDSFQNSRQAFPLPLHGRRYTGSFDQSIESYGSKLATISLSVSLVMKAALFSRLDKVVFWALNTSTSSWFHRVPIEAVFKITHGYQERRCTASFYHFIAFKGNYAKANTVWGLLFF